MADYNYLSASNGTGDASIMHVTASRAVGIVNITVDSNIGVPNYFIASQGTLLADGFIDPSTICNFKGHLNGTTGLIIDGFEPGSTDTGSTVGQVIVIKPNTAWVNDMVTLAQVSHNNDGSLKGGIVTGDKVASGTLLSSNLSSTAGITGTQINWSTIQAQPTAQPIKIVQIQMGYNSTAYLYRCGNLVQLSMNTVVAYMPQGGLPIGETVPVGYRPASSVFAMIAGVMTDGAQLGGVLHWQINGDGSMYIQNSKPISGQTRIGGSSMWITDNAWPV